MSMTTLSGGLEIEVQFDDGTTEKVFLAQLKIHQFPHYDIVFSNEPRAVELLCGKPEGWSHKLTNESFELLLTRGREINASFFERWRTRRKDCERLQPPRDPEEVGRVLEMLQQKNPALLERILTQAVGGLPSPTSLPKPPSKPA